jgi:outer membrane protein OmpA-like peptidoglycan-associated protein/tetratricopeptide (TPR) repeat protein
MKIYFKNLSYCAVILMFTLHASGQKKSISNADKNFANYLYVDAIATYEKVADKGYKDEKMFQKLGDAYYFIANLEKAEKWYTELFNMNANQQAEYCYRYSQTLKAVKNYAKADKILEQFVTKSADDQRAILYVNQRDYLKDIKANSGRFEIADAGVNSQYSDYGSALYDNKLVFASARDTGGVSKKVFKWNNEYFTNLYFSQANADGSMTKPKLFSKVINSKFHESTPIFTKDLKTMYFTRNNYLDGKKRKDSKKVTLLKLYKANQEEGKWVNVQELPFNSNEYSVAHPALSVDEKTLYFASDMPGTKGLSDLFSVTINSDGTYGMPQNLGFPINTASRETFPFISNDNKLYFASDGHPGLGGLDIFVSQVSPINNYKEIQNVGAPVNSSKDDFGFLVDSNTNLGFFTSNREAGKGLDDIYKFVQRATNPICNQVLKGIVTDLETGLILTNTKLSLFDDQFNLINEVSSGNDGKYTLEVVCGKIYYVRAEKLEYDTKESKVIIAATSGETTRPLALEKRKKVIDVGSDLAKSLDIPILFFDLDKSFIRKDAAFELEKVLAVMQQYPNMKIDIRSHTDSRQTNDYNEKLSNKRAKATRAWLIAKGIEATRLTAKGYGETQLVNKCADGVDCTEQEHQGNRRSEFVIVSIK